MFDPMGSWDPRQLDEKPTEFNVEDFENVETPPGKCPRCKGGGDEVCYKQHYDDDSCEECHGTGLKWCTLCDGTGNYLADHSH